MPEFVRHPTPSGYLRGKQGWRGGTVHGRTSAERVVSLLRRAHPETMTTPQIARELGVAHYLADQMALTAWRNGQAEFATGTFHLEWRAIVETEVEYTVGQYRRPDGRRQWAVLHGPTNTWYFANLHGKIAAETLCRKLNRTNRETT